MKHLHSIRNRFRFFLCMSSGDMELKFETLKYKVSSDQDHFPDSSKCDSEVKVICDTGETRGYRVGPKVDQTGDNWDKSGTLFRILSLICKSRGFFLIWGRFDPNITSGCRIHLCL